MKGYTMEHLVRITGHNGVVYEERMTEGQITRFLRLTEARTSLGVAFEEWEITVISDEMLTCTSEAEYTVSEDRRKPKRIEHAQATSTRR